MSTRDKSYRREITRYEKHCPRCGKRFRTRQILKRYCSKACAKS